MGFRLEDKILAYLCKQDDKVRRTDIVEGTGSTVNSVRNTMPGLIKAGLVMTSNGYYVATQAGRTQKEADPFLTAIPRERPQQKVVVQSTVIPDDKLSNAAKILITRANELPNLGDLEKHAQLYTVALMIHYRQELPEVAPGYSQNDYEFVSSFINHVKNSNAPKQQQQPVAAPAEELSESNAKLRDDMHGLAAEFANTGLMPETYNGLHPKLIANDFNNVFAYKERQPAYIQRVLDWFRNEHQH